MIPKEKPTNATKNANGNDDPPVGKEDDNKKNQTNGFPTDFR